MGQKFVLVEIVLVETVLVGDPLYVEIKLEKIRKLSQLVEILSERAKCK